MSFNFEWPTFSEGFHADAREMLAQVTNIQILHTQFTIRLTSY